MDAVDLEKKITQIRQSMQTIENDWDFDKRKAQEIFVTMQREALEALKEARQRRREQELEEKQHTAKEEKATVQQENDPLDLVGGDDDDGGLFGNMLDEEEEQQQSTVTPNDSKEEKVSWQLVDLAKPGWIGRYPKDMLQEFCKQNTEYRKQVYATTSLGGCRWRATVKLVSRQPFHDPRIVEIPHPYATNNTKDAEQLVAVSWMGISHHLGGNSSHGDLFQMAALFELDPTSSIYRIMSTPFKDLWLQWVEEKVNGPF